MIENPPSQKPTMKQPIHAQQQPQQQQQQQFQQETVKVPVAAIQQMQQRMAQMEEVIREQAAQRQPQEKTYSQQQVQIAMCCDTISQILEEFELSNQKASRLLAARNWLLLLADMREFMIIPQQTEATSKQGQDQEPEQVMEDQDSLFEDDGIGIPTEESYPGEMEGSVTDSLADIQTKMNEIRAKEEVAKKQAAMSPIDKLKAFVSKKKPEIQEVGKDGKPDGMKGVAEGMG